MDNNPEEILQQYTETSKLEFNKDTWLEKLASDIKINAETVLSGDKMLGRDVEDLWVIDMVKLDKILQYYFPQIKLIDYE